MQNHVLIGVFMTFFLSSCISVKVPFEANSKASNVSFQNPSSPYIPLETEIADSAWISERTANTISYLSECKSQNADLEAIAMDTIKGIDRVKVEKRESQQVSGHPALEIIAVGTVDRSPVKIAVTTVRHGNCVVNISYGGLLKHFSQELGHYQDFKKGFRIP
ncbi:MAG: hypothetical protein ACK5Y2_12140 [Bdellovibrionales bacterium]